MSKVIEWMELYNTNGYDATPMLAEVKEDPLLKFDLRVFWKELTKQRLWIGEAGCKRQGWAYPDPKDVLGLLGEARVITIGDLGAKTSSKSNSCYSVLGLVRMIRGGGYTGKIFIKAKITDSTVWKEILQEVKE
jgi:hypothetical protein